MEYSVDFITRKSVPSFLIGTFYLWMLCRFCGTAVVELNMSGEMRRRKDAKELSPFFASFLLCSSACMYNSNTAVPQKLCSVQKIKSNEKKREYWFPVTLCRAYEVQSASLEHLENRVCLAKPTFGCSSLKSKSNLLKNYYLQNCNTRILSYFR